MLISTQEGPVWVVGQVTKQQLKALKTTEIHEDDYAVRQMLAIILMGYPGMFGWAFIGLYVYWLSPTTPWLAPSIWASILVGWLGVLYIDKKYREYQVKRAQPLYESGHAYRVLRANCTETQHDCTDNLFTVLLCAAGGRTGLLLRHKPEVDNFLQDSQAREIMELLSHTQPEPSPHEKNSLRDKLFQMAHDAIEHIDFLDEPYNTAVQLENEESEARKHELMSWKVERALE